MPSRLLRRIHRERRRLVVVAVVLFAAARLVAGGTGAALPHGGPLGFALATTVALAAVAILRPAWRRIGETVALAGLACAGLGRVWPESAFAPRGDTADWLVAGLAWAGLAALVRVVLDRAATAAGPRLGDIRLRARSGSRVDIRPLWSGLVATPEPGVGDDTRLGGRAPPGGTPAAGHETLRQILDIEAPFRLRYRELGPRPPPAGPDDPPVVELFLVDLGPRRLVLLRHDYLALPLGRLIDAWLDDTLGRTLDARLAAAERLAASAGFPGPTTPDARA